MFTMQDESKIVSVTIGPMPRPMPMGMSDPMPVVKATFDDGICRELFSYYPDEISFTESEFIGLTATQAHARRSKKDLAYIRS